MENDNLEKSENLENTNSENIKLKNDKNAELREILRKRKAQKESSINTNSNLQENSNATIKQDRIYFKNEFEKRAYKATKQAEFKLKQSQIEKEQYRQVLETKKQNNPNFRDYDENPLIINCYDEIFLLTLQIFVSILALYLLLYFCLICGIVNEEWSQSEKVVQVMLTCILVGYITIICIVHSKYFSDYKIKFTNNYIYFIHNGKIKKSCPVIKDELVRPFFVYSDGKTKNGLVTEIFIYISLFFIFIATFGFIFFGKHIN